MSPSAEQAQAEWDAKQIRKLFRAVIARAIQDAIYTRKGSGIYQKHTQSSAIDWLCGSTPHHLKEVCDLASVDHIKLMTRCKKIFENGSPNLKYVTELNKLAK